MTRYCYTYISDKCNINIISYDLRTPLLIAVELDDLEFVKSLIKSGELFFILETKFTGETMDFQTFQISVLNVGVKFKVFGFTSQSVDF